MNYVITGSTILNDVLYADGSAADGLLGGTLYTVCGIKPFCDDIVFVTSAGPDFAHYYGPYFRDNGMTVRGVGMTLPKTQYNTLKYEPSGEWREFSKYGPAFERQYGEAALVHARQVLEQLDGATGGIYFESRVGESVWDGLDAFRKKAPRAKIMWELSTLDIDDPTLWPAVRTLIRQVDVYSINLPESRHFFGVDTEKAAIRAILDFGVPCFFRVGSKGSYMIQDGRAWFAPSVDSCACVDATGCGNCSTGAALYGFTEGFHPLKTAVCANLAAGLNIRQYGPYPLFTPALRAELAQKEEEMFARLLTDESGI